MVIHRLDLYRLVIYFYFKQPFNFIKPSIPILFYYFILVLVYLIYYFVKRVLIIFVTFVSGIYNFYHIIIVFFLNQNCLVVLNFLKCK